MFNKRNFKRQFRSVPTVRRRHLFIEQLECRRLLATILWDGGGNGTAWSDAANWDTNSLPTSADDVIINVASNPAISVTGIVTVNSLITHESITFGSGTFTSLSVQLNAAGTISSASIVGANFNGTGTLQITSVDGTLNQVTLGLNTTLRTGAQVTVLGGLTLAGGSRLLLEQNSNCDNSSTIDVGLNFAGGVQLLGGSGVVELYNAAGTTGCGHYSPPVPQEDDVRVRPTGAGTLTIGSGVTVRNTTNSTLTTLGDATTGTGGALVN